MANNSKNSKKSDDSGVSKLGSTLSNLAGSFATLSSDGNNSKSSKSSKKSTKSTKTSTKSSSKSGSKTSSKSSSKTSTKSSSKSTKSGGNKSSKSPVSSAKELSAEAARELAKKPTKKKSSARRKRHWKLRIAAAIIVAVVIAVSFLFESKINSLLRLKGVDENEYDGLNATEVVGGGEGAISLGERLNIHFIDVGQGDACIIELPDDKKLIIDGGKDKEKQKLLTYIDENIYDENDQKIDRFDYAILTHSDEDHCGGLDDVMTKYSVGTFYRPNQLANYKNYVDPNRASLFGEVDKNAKSTLAYMRAIDAGHKAADSVIVTDARRDSQNKITPSGIDKQHAEYYEINFYTPTKNNYKDVNDYSPIIILEYQNKRIALSGDAEAEAEAEFVSLATNGSGRYSIFDSSYTVDLIKMGHHGSRTSTSDAYVEAITTSSSIENVIIIVSCGTGNSYGHPHSDAIERLIALGVSEQNILRTDINGNIVMSIREDEGNVYQLYYGAELVRSSYSKVVAWREIALLILVIAYIILIIAPLLNLSAKEVKEAVAS